MDSLSIEEFKQALPASLQRSVNPELLAQINAKLHDPDMREIYRDNMIGYVSVMTQGKFKLSSYVDAIKYVSLRLQDRTCIEAFALTFPEKINRWQLLNYAKKDVASNVTSYNKSKLVNLIYEQTLTPFWVLNQDIYQKAINTQADLMISAKSEKVRCDAANSLLTQLKPPETSKIELDITTKQDSTIDALRESTKALVDMQRDLIEGGSVNAQQIAHTPLVIHDESVVASVVATEPDQNELTDNSSLDTLDVPCSDDPDFLDAPEKPLSPFATTAVAP